jgi:D-amino-acid oxidase
MLSEYRKKDDKSNAGKPPLPWFKDMVSNFKEVPREELPPTADSAISYDSMCINTALYLPWLTSQCLENGVIFKRANLTSLASASSLHHSGTTAALVVNCTGISARSLNGLGPDGTGDKRVYPARGQIVLVRNTAKRMVELTAPIDGGDEMTYIMTRAAGGGTILGGCYQKNKWESQPDPNLALRIMTRAVELCPELTNGKGVEELDVVRHTAGLRPVREGGTRIGASWIDGVLVVHNYGHGGFGYQASYGCSMTAVKIVENVLNNSGGILKEQDVN